MRSRMKISFASKLERPLGPQTRLIQNATANIDLIKKIIILLAAFLIPSQTLRAKPIEEIPTSVCFRRISAVVKGVEYNNYETVIVKSSGRIDKDIFRMNQFNDKNGLMKSPHIKAFIWLGAFLYDRRFDGVHSPNCSNLPKLKPD